VADHDTLFDIESHDEPTRAEYERLRQELQEVIGAFAEEKDISHAYLALLLIDLGVTSRMVDYVLSVEKPSASGLKLELDRVRREIDDYVRSSKKSAEEFVAASKKALAETESEAPDAA
jgi:hypothetical protein